MCLRTLGSIFTKSCCYNTFSGVAIPIEELYNAANLTPEMTINHNIRECRDE